MIAKTENGEIMDQFVAIVNRELERQQMAVADLAERAGCGRQYLYRVLNGEHSVSIKKAADIAGALGITIKIVPPQK